MELAASIPLVSHVLYFRLERIAQGMRFARGRLLRLSLGLGLQLDLGLCPDRCLLGLAHGLELGPRFVLPKILARVAGDGAGRGAGKLTARSSEFAGKIQNPKNTSRSLKKQDPA